MRRNRRYRPKNRQPNRLGFESLESRQLLAADLLIHEVFSDSDNTAGIEINATAIAIVEATVVNLPATDITAFTAEVGIEVLDTGDDPPDLFLHWGTTDGVTTVGDWDEEIPLGIIDVGTLPAELLGLAQDTQYHYRVRAENQAGTSWAPLTASFTTVVLSAATLVTTPAALVDDSSAIISGVVTDTGGDAPEVTIYYGPENGETDADAWSSFVLIGNRADFFSTTLLGLDAETTYFYRAHASNGFGESWSLLSRSFATAAAPTLQISEFMAVNDNTLPTRTRDSVGDAFSGEADHPDWIEIRNLTDQPIDLGGMHLTDRDDELQQWAFPAGTSIEADGYLVVYASGDDITDPALDETGRLHAGFSLSSKGEYLALTDAAGEIIDQYDFPSQVADVSYGQFDGEPRYFATSTPGADNVDDFINVVADTKFSVDRGIYTDPFELEITTKTAGATIRYTLNGSHPTQTNGTIYTGPISITGTIAVRALAYKTDFEPTDIDTQTYIFPADVVSQSVMSPSIVNHAIWGPQLQDSLLALPTISLVTPNSFSLTERESSIEMIFPDGTKGFQADVGVEHFGNAGLGSPKKSMRISFKKIYGVGTLNYDLFEGTKHEDTATDEFGQILLRSGSHDTFYWTHPSGRRGAYVRGRWASDRQLEMNQPAPRGRFVHVYINGTYWGQHHLMERPNDEFMASYFGGDGEDYDAINAGVAIDGDLGEWNSMLGSIANYDELQKHMDVENYIDYMLLNFYGGNDWDWNSGHNWMAATEDDNGTDTGEGFKFFAWDSDLLLRTSAGANVINRGGPGNIWNISGGPKQHAEFRQMLIDRAQKYFFNGGMFTDERLRSDFDALADQIRLSMIAETARWGAPSAYTPDTWQNEIDNIKNVFAPEGSASRAATVIQQMRAAGVFPQTDAPVFNQHGGGVTPLFELDIKLPEGTSTPEDTPIYYTLDGSDPMSPGALVFDGTPFALDDNTQVKTRAKNGDEWSALNQANFAFVKLTVRITEVNYNPFDPTASELAQQDPLDDPFDDDDFEFIEMHNTGDESVNLINFTLAGDVSMTLPTFVVEPDQYALLVRDEEAFFARYGNSLQDLVIGEYSSKLSDGSGEITVHDSIGTLIHKFTYDDSGSWPGRADGKGSTLEVLDTSGDYNDSENWRSSGEFNGTPGAEGQGLDNRVVINELLTHTDPPQTDAIELFNTTNAPIDVGGWYLSDNNNQYNKFRIPDGTIIAARGYLAFDESDFNSSPGEGENGFALDGAHGEDVYLLSGDASGNVLYFIDHVEINGALNGISFGRWPDETSRLRPLQWNSFGRENAYPVMPDLMISEIHYNPAHATPRAWTKQAGNWKIAGGHLESFGDLTGTVNYLATIDAEQTDVTVDVTANFPAELNSEPAYGLFDLDASGIIGRYNSSFDFLVVGIRQFSSEVGVWKYAGIWTEVVAPVAIPGGVVAGDDYRLSATFDGTMITVSVNGNELISDNVPINTTGTQFGVRAFSEGDQFDDFLLTPLDGSPLTTDSFSRDGTNGLGMTDELGDDMEFIEIYNATDATVDLTGWRLRKGIDYDFVEPGASAVSLDAGETIVVLSFNPANPLNANRTGQFRSVHNIDPSVSLVGGYGGKLSNKGEAIELQRPDMPPLLEPDFTPHIVTDRVVYEVVAPWPDVSRSFDSLNRASIDTLGFESASWQASAPTPGSETMVVAAPRVVGVGAGGPVYGTSQVIEASAAGITTLEIYFNAPEYLLGPTRILDGAIQLNDNGQSGSGTYRQFDLDAAITHRWLEVTTGGTTPAESMFVGQLLGDLDGNHAVGAGDLSRLFGSATSTDITGDGITNAADLVQILAMWGNALPEILLGDPATSATSPEVIDAAIIELSTEPAMMGPLPTLIAEPIGPQEVSSFSRLRTRRALRPELPNDPTTRLARRRRLLRSAVDVVIEEDVLIRLAARTTRSGH